MKVLGIIGGMGPMATAYFMERIIDMTDADSDQEHIRMYLASNPCTPDRTAYILGDSRNNPIDNIIEEGLKLKTVGAEIIAIPCATAHFFQEEISNGIGLPVINVINETAEYLAERNIKRVGILATDGAVSGNLFQTAMTSWGIEAILPDDLHQKDVMEVIYNSVKAGKAVNFDRLIEVSDYLINKGAELLLLGCTELSVAIKDYKYDYKYLDVLDVLARKTVLECGKLKNEYIELITR